MTDDELREQLALHAVGALTDAERRELEDVLRSRPDLRAELDELEAAAATLADAVPATPPAALRASVLDAIAVTPQLPAEPRDEAPVAPVVPISARRRRSRFAAIGAAAAAVVAIAVGVLVVGHDVPPMLVRSRIRPSRMRVLTVPRATPRCSEICTWVSPS